MKRECEICIKKKTIYYPVSIECMATDEMPYYQNRIMLLEENQQLKDKINKALHRIQLLQMDGEVSIKDLGKIANILIDKEVE